MTALLYLVLSLVVVLAAHHFIKARRGLGADVVEGLVVGFWGQQIPREQRPGAFWVNVYAGELVGLFGALVFLWLILMGTLWVSFETGVPPLVRGASSGGGGEGYDCQLGLDPAMNPKFSRSPELTDRLRQSFPPGSPSARLRVELVQQGFQLEGPCPRMIGQAVDPNVRWAQYRKNGNEVVANVYWRETRDGRLTWTFGDVFYTFL